MKLCLDYYSQGHPHKVFPIALPLTADSHESHGLSVCNEKKTLRLILKNIVKLINTV